MKYTKGYKYQLHDDEIFTAKIKPALAIVTRYIVLLPTGDLIIKVGYAWDGPSGPTYDSDNSLRGSLYHDAMYQLIRMQLLLPKHREVADYELDRILKEDGMWWPRRKMWVRALRMFGGSAASPASRRKILTAP